MSPLAFLELVEIKTKLASLLPFIIGLLFTLYRFGEFNLKNTLIFFAAMIIFDMTTTGINTYMDWKKAENMEYKHNVNVIGRKNLKERTVVATILSMLFIATALGIYLVYLTTPLVLIIGMFCFAIGIFYTWGPIPLSRLPLGEIFSGITMGFGIRFLIIYVNIYHLGLLTFSLTEGQFVMSMDLMEMIIIALISLPGVFTISNVMLANNICDLEEDISNNRFTVVYYIGRGWSLFIFTLMNYLALFALYTAVLLGFLPVTVGFVLILVIPPVLKNTRKFRQRQVKSETFILSLKNLLILNGATAFAIALHLGIQYFMN